MLLPGVLRDPSALASVVEDQPFAESAFAECMVVLVMALQRGSAMAIIAMAAAPTRGLHY